MVNLDVGLTSCTVERGPKTSSPGSGRGSGSCANVELKLDTDNAVGIEWAMKTWNCCSDLDG